jgi:hypothetical protein
MNKLSLERIKRLCIKTYIISYNYKNGSSNSTLRTAEISFEGIKGFVEKTLNIQDVIITSIIKDPWVNK